MFRRTRGQQGLIPGLEILLYLYDSNNPRAGTEIPRVDAVMQCVEISTSLVGI